MPELPDVENYCRYLKQHGLHKRIEGVTVGAPRILKGISGPGLGRRLEGHTLERARSGIEAGQLGAEAYAQRHLQ